MRSSSFKLAIPAAAVAAILAVAPMQLGSSHVFGFAQALAAGRGGTGGHAVGTGAVGNGAAGNVNGSGVVSNGGFGGDTVGHQISAQGAGNPYASSVSNTNSRSDAANEMR
jgi:hypothetical protein